jgi:hypothetical protein
MAFRGLWHRLFYTNTLYLFRVAFMKAYGRSVGQTQRILNLGNSWSCTLRPLYHRLRPLGYRLGWNKAGLGVVLQWKNCMSAWNQTGIFKSIAGHSTVLADCHLFRLSGGLFNDVFSFGKSHDSSVGIALGYGLDDRGSRVGFPAGAGNFSLHHRLQNGSGAHPASYPMGTTGSFPGSKAAEVWSWPLTSI